MRHRQLAYAPILAFVCFLTGCVPSAVPRLSYHPIECTQPQVLVHPELPVWQGRLVVNSFSTAQSAPGVGETLARAYQQQLLRTGYFKQIALADVPAQGSASPPAPNPGDSPLILTGNVVYLLAGTGGTPSKLCVEVKVIDPSRQLLLWYVRQEASSNPGPDVDLFWSTIPGSSALPYQALADAMAKQFAALVTPQNDEKSGTQVKSPFTNPIGTGSSGL